MQLLILFLIGVIATAVMTIFMRISSKLSPVNFSVLEFLQTIIARLLPFFRIEPAFLWISAILLHYGIGIAFVYHYDSFGIEYMKEPFSFLLHWLSVGFYFGTIAVLVWSLSFLFILEKYPLQVISRFLVHIFIAHFVFALVMIYMYGMII